MDVRLTAREMYEAAELGIMRNQESIESGRQPRFPERYPGELFDNHILGAIAERAVAKALGVEWVPHINHFESGDVAGCEVRYSSRGDVKVRPRDSGIVIGVTGTPPLLSVVGFVHASYARNHYEPYAPRPGPPAYFVPHEDLTPIELLINHLGELK